MNLCGALDALVLFLGSTKLFQTTKRESIGREALSLSLYKLSSKKGLYVSYRSAIRVIGRFRSHSYLKVKKKSLTATDSFSGGAIVWLDVGSTLLIEFQRPLRRCNSAESLPNRRSGNAFRTLSRLRLVCRRKLIWNSFSSWPGLVWSGQSAPGQSYRPVDLSSSIVCRWPKSSPVWRTQPQQWLADKLYPSISGLEIVTKGGGSFLFLLDLVLQYGRVCVSPVGVWF